MSDSSEDCPTLKGFEYVIIGSGPGGGPLAANLARRGHSVLLLEAGDDQGQNLNQKVPFFWPAASEDPSMRWDFFVKNYSDETQAAKNSKLVWETPSGAQYIGLNPPEGSTQKGIWYPRAGTLGGCASHNALATVLPHDSDWQYIVDTTKDKSWAPEKMRKYYERIERCHYLPQDTRGHGFNGWLETDIVDPVIVTSNEPIVSAAIEVADINAVGGQNIDGVYNFALSMSRDARRSGPRNYLVATSNARNPDGTKKYPLHIKTRCFATKLLFAPHYKGRKPRVVGVEFLEGESLYKADPRYDARRVGVRKRVLASREVVVAGGAFNTPQLLMLSGIGPREELDKFEIPVIVDLPGVGSSLQDNYELSVVGRSPEAFSILKESSAGGPGDFFLEQWVKGFGLYKGDGIATCVIKKSERSDEEDLFLFGTPGIFTGFFPGFSKTFAGDFHQWTCDVLKFRPNNFSGTVRLRSGSPFDVPEINFEYFAKQDDAHRDNNPEHDLSAIVEGVQLAREILKGVKAPVGPFADVTPASSANTSREIKAAIKAESFGHHAASTCRIGGDDDPMACLDSQFRVRGVDSLRVVDASVFPRAVGTFPTLPLYMVSEKACDAILDEVARDDAVLDGIRDREVLHTHSSQQGHGTWGIVASFRLIVSSFQSSSLSSRLSIFLLFYLGVSVHQLLVWTRSAPDVYGTCLSSPRVCYFPFLLQVVELLQLPDNGSSRWPIHHHGHLQISLPATHHAGQKLGDRWHEQDMP
ncbi:GMC oxidoreductase [Xylariaceae sp. FL1272]|nr:GMC oxidoreductase [Xylariaceae sp. FL1272]